MAAAEMAAFLQGDHTFVVNGGKHTFQLPVISHAVVPLDLLPPASASPLPQEQPQVPQPTGSHPVGSRRAS